MTVEARAARETVLAVELADRAALLARGKDRIGWLNGLVTCDLAKLGPYGAAYGLVVEKKGRIQTDFFAVPSATESVLALAVPRDLRAATFETLDHYLIMEDVELETAELVFWQLVGPKAAELATAASTSWAGTLQWAGADGAILGVPANESEAFAKRLGSLVESVGGRIADESTWEAIRIERGVPRFGVEVDATLYPQEASLEKIAVAFDKGCYLGQEVVYMLENRGHVKRKLVALEIDGDALAEKGTPVTTAEGAAVGDVKSGAIGPESGRAVAIAMVKWAQAQPGTELRVGERVARVRG